jgi:hypothetical protein
VETTEEDPALLVGAPALFEEVVKEAALVGAIVVSGVAFIETGRIPNAFK